MKALHTILTILFVVSLLFGILPFLSTANTAAGGTLAGIFGNVLAFVTIPTIIWVIRHFVGKNLNK